jgi:hypothetical protein
MRYLTEEEINLLSQGSYGFFQKQECCLDLFNIEMLYSMSENRIPIDIIMNVDLLIFTSGDDRSFFRNNEKSS